MHTYLRAGLVLAAVAASGCSYEEAIRKFAPKEVVDLATRTLEQVRTGRYADAESNLEPSIVDATTEERLRKISDVLSLGAPTSVALIGAHSLRAAPLTTTNLTFQLEFPRGWILAVVGVRQTDGGPPRIYSLHARPLPDSLERTHAFTLRGRSASHYLVLLAAVVFASFTVAMLVACAREAGLPRKWRWILFILLGVGGVTLDWTSGAMRFQLASVHLLSAGAVRTSPYAPWMVTVAFPLGAVLYAIRRLRRRPGAAAMPAPQPGPGLE